MKVSRLLIAGLLAAVWIALPLQAALAQDASPVSGELLARFEAIIRSEMAHYHIPGAAVAVIQEGEVVYSQGFGVRNVATGEPFTPQTQFSVGSTTKSMTSLVIAQLVDEGVLSWDTPVVELYPAFKTSDPGLTARLTVRDLMSMGTGLEPDAMKSLAWGEATEADVFSAIATMQIAGEYRQHYAYNNEVYASAAYVAAMAAGQEPTLAVYEQLMQARLFEPAGMTSTLITDDASLLDANHSLSYSFTLIDAIAEPDLALRAPIHVVAPAGGAWSTLEDMSRYVITQMNGGITPDGARIVSAANLATTWEPQVTMPANGPGIERLSYGMGWVIGSYEGVPFRYHDGGWAGYRTMMAIFPDSQTGLIIFANHVFGDLATYALTYSFAELLEGRDPAALLDEFRALFAESFGSIEAQLASFPPPEVKAEEVNPLLGRYEQGWTVELRDDSRLWLVRPNWEFVLRPLPGGKLYVVASGGALGAVVQFTLEGDQETMSVGFGDRQWSFAKIE